jgi:hypothetical protein
MERSRGHGSSLTNMYTQQWLQTLVARHNEWREGVKGLCISTHFPIFKTSEAFVLHFSTLCVRAATVVFSTPLFKFKLEDNSALQRDFYGKIIICIVQSPCCEAESDSATKETPCML